MFLKSEVRWSLRVMTPGQVESAFPCVCYPNDPMWLVEILTYNLSEAINSHINVFSMSSCMATSILVYNGGWVQKLLQLFNSSEIL